MNITGLSRDEKFQIVESFFAKLPGYSPDEVYDEWWLVEETISCLWVDKVRVPRIIRDVVVDFHQKTASYVIEHDEAYLADYFPPAWKWFLTEDAIEESE